MIQLTTKQKLVLDTWDSLPSDVNKLKEISHKLAMNPNGVRSMMRVLTDKGLFSKTKNISDYQRKKVTVALKLKDRESTVIETEKTKQQALKENKAKRNAKGNCEVFSMNGIIYTVQKPVSFDPIWIENGHIKGKVMPEYC